MVPSVESLRAPAGLSPGELDKHINGTVLPAIEALMKSKDLADIDLNALSPALDTLPYLFALNFKISGPKSVLKKAQSPDFSSGGDLMRWTVAFAEQSDSVQLRYAGSEFRVLLNALASMDPQASNAVSPPRPLVVLGSRLERWVYPAWPAARFTSSHISGSC